MPGTARARAVGFNHVALEVGDIEAALSFLCTDIRVLASLSIASS
jgi:hypothetical protein